MKIRARVADLWRDGCGGWTENASWSREAIVEVPDDASDLAISRKVKASLGITGMRADHWCTSDFGPWRDGCIGAYADVVEGGEE
jgi:hypothetical protein